jgi:hypothetical protein
MQIPAEIRKCVGFVAVEPGGGYRVVGTFFLVGVDVGQDRFLPYAVTAAHVIDGVRHLAVDGNVWLRMNRTGGAGLLWVFLPLSEWRGHPTDPVIDVSAAPLAVGIDQADYRTLPRSLFATEELLASESVGIGDEVFLPGLFVHHFGAAQNIPIVRTGAIAAMPEEPIATGRGRADAYLIEARSIGGLSGSPVFVYLSPLRSGVLRFGQRHPFLLIGLMHGHWEVDPARVSDAIGVDGLRDELVNMGIGIVVPVRAIAETLDQPHFLALNATVRASLDAAEDAAADIQVDADHA